MIARYQRADRPTTGRRCPRRSTRPRQYYRGKAVRLRHEQRQRPRARPATRSLYQSPADRRAVRRTSSCYLTDGEPTQDNDADSKIKRSRTRTATRSATSCAGGNLRHRRATRRVQPRRAATASTILRSFCYKGDQSSLAGRPEHHHVHDRLHGRPADPGRHRGSRWRRVLHGQRHGIALDCAVEHRDLDSRHANDVRVADGVGQQLQPHAELERSVHQRVQGVAEYALARQPEEVPAATSDGGSSTQTANWPRRTRPPASSPTRRRATGRRTVDGVTSRPAARRTRFRLRRRAMCYTYLGSNDLTRREQSRRERPTRDHRRDAQHRRNPATRRAIDVHRLHQRRGRRATPTRTTARRMPRMQMGDPLHSQPDDRRLRPDRRRRDRVLRDERRLPARDRRDDRRRAAGRSSRRIFSATKSELLINDFATEQGLRHRRQPPRADARRQQRHRSSPRARRCTCSSACGAAATSTTGST